MRHIRVTLAILTLMAAPRPVTAQFLRTTFPVDLGSGAIAGTLPFDEPFVLSAPTAATWRAVRMWVGSGLQIADCSALGLPSAAAPDSQRPDSARKSNIADINAKRADYEKNSTTLKTAVTNAEVAYAANPSSQNARALAEARQALRNLAIRLTPTAAWDRGKLDSATTLLLEAGPIEPNKRYIFCFEIVRDPSKDEAAAFVKTATANLAKVVRGFAALKLSADAQLDSMQLALIAALPQADSIVVSPTSVFYITPAAEHESTAARQLRLQRLVELYARTKQAETNAGSNVSAFYTNDTLMMRRLLQFPPQQATLLGLSRTFETKDGISDYSRGLSSAAALARNLASISQDIGVVEMVSKGTMPLGSRDRPLAGLGIASSSDSATLATADRNLQLTAARLDSLRSLTEYVGSDTTLMRRAGVTSSSLESVRAVIRDLQEVIRAKRSELDQIRLYASLVAKQVDATVATVSTLDLAHVALRGTTYTTYTAAATNYVGLDAGFLGGSHLGQTTPYFGVNVYLRPVNRNMHIPFLFGYWSRRFSFTVGVTASSVKQDNRVDDLFSGHAILFGLGYRLSDYVRVTGGVLGAKTFPNGTQNPAKPSLIPVWSGSLDIDIANALGKATSLIIPNLK